MFNRKCLEAILAVVIVVGVVALVRQAVVRSSPSALCYTFLEGAPVESQLGELAERGYFEVTVPTGPTLLGVPVRDRTFCRRVEIWELPQ